MKVPRVRIGTLMLLVVVVGLAFCAEMVAERSRVRAAGASVLTIDLDDVSCSTVLRTTAIVWPSWNEIGRDALKITQKEAIHIAKVFMFKTRKKNPRDYAKVRATFSETDQ